MEKKDSFSSSPGKTSPNKNQQLQADHQNSSNTESTSAFESEDDNCDMPPPSYNEVVSPNNTVEQPLDTSEPEPSHETSINTSLRRTSSTSYSEKISLPKINCEEKIVSVNPKQAWGAKLSQNCELDSLCS